jgi:hypothetical protein
MENNGGAPDPDNKPPTINGIGDQTIAIGKPLKLTASATDDGLPKPPPELPRPATTTIPVTAGFGGKRARGVSISWIVVRNPATGGEATFNPDSSGAPVYGKPVESATSVTFSEPGTYWLRAVASDTSLDATHDIKVTVTPR